MMGCEWHPDYKPFDHGKPLLDCRFCWDTYVRWQEELLEELLKAANKAYDLLSRIEDEIPFDDVSYALAKAIEKAKRKYFWI